LTTTGGFPVWEYLLLFAVLVGVMVLTTILPQRRRDRETRETLERVRRGVRVITRGGMYGMVTDVQDDAVMVRIADKVEVRMTKTAIAEVVRSADQTDDGGDGGPAKNGRKGRRSG
jgi:preprotein translocase subunit YajC